MIQTKSGPSPFSPYDPCFMFHVLRIMKIHFTHLNAGFEWHSWEREKEFSNKNVPTFRWFMHHMLLERFVSCKSRKKLHTFDQKSKRWKKQDHGQNTNQIHNDVIPVRSIIIFLFKYAFHTLIWLKWNKIKFFVIHRCIEGSHRMLNEQWTRCREKKSEIEKDKRQRRQ